MHEKKEIPDGSEPGRRIHPAVSALMAVMLCGSLAGCTPEPTDQTLIRIAGSSTVLPVASRAAEWFMKNRPDVKITVNGGGSGVGIKSVGSGIADIGMISRDISEAEAAQFPGISLHRHVVGRDAVACVVSAGIYEAGVTELSMRQLEAIFSGRIRNWKAVGGPDREIVVVDKEFHRGTRHVFMRFLFGDANAPAKGATIVAGSNNEAQTKIAMSNAAIGMLSFAWLNDRIRGVAIRTGEELVSPTWENVKSGKYPIARNLSLLTVNEPAGLIKDYIDFVLGEAGQRIVEESGYVPVG